MKASELIKTLETIIKKYGDISVTGGAMCDDIPLSNVTVTDVDGFEIWPRDFRSDQTKKPVIDGIFFE